MTGAIKVGPCWRCRPRINQAVFLTPVFNATTRRKWDRLRWLCVACREGAQTGWQQEKAA